MRYGILGTTQAHTGDGRPAALGGARLRALLAALALHPGRVRTAEALIGEVWGDEPPADAAGALQALVGRLRRAVGHDAVASAAGGYRLCAEPGDVDLYRFQQLADEGARALADGDPAKAAGLLGAGLALWRGPVLADLPGRAALAVRYEARHLDARRTQLSAAVALGRSEQILPELSALCEAHPLDEPLHAVRLRALRAAGRPAEALAAYADIASDLAGRLGTDPGPELRALHAELLNPERGIRPGTRRGAAPPQGTPPGARHPFPAPNGAAPPQGSPYAPAGLAPDGSADSQDAPYPADRPAAHGTAGTAQGTPRHLPGSAPGGTPDHPQGTPGPLPGPATHGTPAPHNGAAPDNTVAPHGRPYPSAAPTADGPAPPHSTPYPPGAPAAHGTATPHNGAAPDSSVAPDRSYPPTTPAPGGTTSPHNPPAYPPGAPTAHGTVAQQGHPYPPAAPAAGGTVLSPGHGHDAHGAPVPPHAGGGTGTTPPPGNLRVRLTSFVGREDDIASIGGDLHAHRLVTLLGPGGAGKTRLSLEAAEAAAANGGGWADGVWFAELAPVDDPATVPEAVLTALGGRETVVRTTADGLRAAGDATATDPLARLAEHCAPRRMLLVLDNCEHVVDAAARLAETLLAHCPGVTVLATSREPLGVPGEAVRPVEPLPDTVALRLLADRGAAARPGFRIEDDPEACAEICRRLDGLPLAIELAAARLRLLGPRTLADRLDDRFRLLTSGSRTVLPRQQTLRAVVDWSWDLLDGPERAVLRRLSVFSGGCDLAAAEAVCSDGPDVAAAHAADAVGARDVAALLGSLVDKSLVVAEPAAGGEMRYRLLETVGEYAAERLDEAGERAGAEHRHLLAYRELARTADPLLRGPAQGFWLEQLELEHDNLRTALRHAVAARDEQEALCLVLSLGWFWQLREHRADASHWAEAVGALGPDPFAGPVAPVPPLYVSCTEQPPPMTPEVLAEARRGVHLTRLVSITDMALVQSPEMQSRLRTIAAAYADGPPQTCRVPGYIVFFAILMTGDFETLYRTLDAIVTRCRELGYTWELGHALQLRSKIFNDHPGGLDQATADAQESVEVFRRLGDSWGVAEGLTGLGEAHERRGQFDLAAEAYREAVEQVRELGSTGQLPALRARLAGALVEAGTVGDEEGEQMLRDAIAEAEQGNTDAAVFGRLQLGVRIARTGRTAEAREIFEELVTDFGIRSVVMFEALMCGQMAWLDTLEGRPADALPRLRKALAMADDPLSTLAVPQLPMTHLVFAAFAHAELAGGPSGEEHALRAARLLGAAEGLRPADFPVASVEREVYERTGAGAREALGDAAYERAYAEGGGLTLKEATALV
ncbi:AfsR/SARP family transcriptional regulator [Streptomyces hiroshimensis]|uniref:Multidomain-containing protein family n=1 Tax=Streptomyces hiroshimensis TaxID=66424 RepID=A0ABQ2Y7K1_9ACTN|nr:BTAD domain-containing putative transcriptional regulator [Streptomyces hiroshimensis]GGX72536.1 multidomain-containing protein family [Streptomyces hiroshimensis]